MSGFIDALIYCLFTGISNVFIDKMDDSINPYLSLLFMASITTIFFMVVNYKHFGKMWQACVNNKLLYFIMNSIIAVNWLCTIFAPNISDPFIYLSINFIVQAILGFLFVKKTTKFDWYLHCAIAIIFVLLITFIVIYYNIANGRSINLGLLFGIFAGLSGYGYGYFSNKLATRANLAPSQILGIRFLLLILILIIIILNPNSKISIHLASTGVYALFLMGFIALITPVYFMQSAYKKIGVMQSSICFGFIPGITFILYSIFAHKFIWFNFIIALIVTLILSLIKLIPKLIFKAEKA